MLTYKRCKKCLLLVMTICLLTGMLSLGAQAEDLPYASPRSQMVRVLLSRLNLTDRMDLTLSTDYLLTTEAGGQLHFRCLRQILLRSAYPYRFVK